MKKLLFFAIALFFALNSFAQDVANFATPNFETYIPHRTRDTIYVLDSSIQSLYNTDWYLSEKYISKDFDNAGRITNDEIYNYDTTNSVWIPDYRRFLTYFSTDEIKSYAAFPYNNNILDWESDTGMYINILLEDHPYMHEPVYQDKYIYMNWDEINNVYSGGRKVLITLDNASNYYQNLDFYDWNLAAGTFDLVENKSFTYNTENFLQNYVYKKADSTGTLQNYQQYFYVFSDGNMIQQIKQKWSVSIWENEKKYTYTYDANGNKTNETYYTWNGSDWVENYKYDYTFDSNNNLLTYIKSNWDNATSQWEPSHKVIYQYNSNNDLTAYIYQEWDNVNDEFVNDYKDIYEYDSYFNNTRYINFDWNSSTSAWDSVEQNIYEYLQDGLMTLNLYQQYDGSSWVNFSQTIYSYDENFNNTQLLYQYWDSGNSAWKNNYKIDYYYSVMETQSVSQVEQTNVQVYPNPASDFLFVKSDNKLDKVLVLNMNGQVVYNSPKLQGQTTVIDMTAFSKGAYLVQIKDSKGNISTRKVIVN